jgi:hypothetical protein
MKKTRITRYILTAAKSINQFRFLTQICFGKKYYKSKEKTQKHNKMNNFPKMPDFDVKKFVRDAGDAIGSNFHRVVQVYYIFSASV